MAPGVVYTWRLSREETFERKCGQNRDKGASIYDVCRGWGKGRSPKSRQKKQSQMISVHDKGEWVKKNEQFADFIYGSPPPRHFAIRGLVWGRKIKETNGQTDRAITIPGLSLSLSLSRWFVSLLSPEATVTRRPPPPSTSPLARSPLRRRLEKSLAVIRGRPSVRRSVRPSVPSPSVWSGSSKTPLGCYTWMDRIDGRTEWME